MSQELSSPSHHLGDLEEVEGREIMAFKKYKHISEIDFSDIPRVSTESTDTEDKRS